MGLGSSLEVTLKEAREAAAEYRAQVRSHKDPIKERDRIQCESAHNSNLLKDSAADAFEARKAQLKGDEMAGRWFSPIEQHVLPKLGKTPVTEINQRDVRDVMTPIWHIKADTAMKAMQRLRIVLQRGGSWPRRGSSGRR